MVKVPESDFEWIVFVSEQVEICQLSPTVLQIVSWDTTLREKTWLSASLRPAPVPLVTTLSVVSKTMSIMLVERKRTRNGIMITTNIHWTIINRFRHSIQGP